MGHKSGGGDTKPSTCCSCFFWWSPGYGCGFWAASPHCSVTLSFLSTNTLKSSGLLSMCSPSSLCLCLGLPQHRRTTLHPSLLNSEAGIGPPLKPVKVPSEWHPCPQVCCQSMLAANLLRMHSIPQFMPPPVTLNSANSQMTLRSPRLEWPPFQPLHHWL